VSQLLGAARLLYWDFERGSLPYDLLVLVMAVALLLAPDALMIDPLRRGR